MHHLQGNIEYVVLSVSLIILLLIKNLESSIPSIYLFIYKLYTYTGFKILKYSVHYIIYAEIEFWKEEVVRIIVIEVLIFSFCALVIVSCTRGSMHPTLENSITHYFLSTLDLQLNNYRSCKSGRYTYLTPSPIGLLLD